MPETASLVADLTSLDEPRAEAAVAALADLGETALEATLPLLQSPSSETRWWAVRVAAAVQTPRAAVALIAALDDRDPLVRQAAAIGLRLQPSIEAAPALVSRLGDRDRLMARLASDALAALGASALPHLRRALRSSDVATRIYATRALASMDEPGVTPYLFAALDDDSPLVQHWAERGLERRGVGMVFFVP
jgi:HEAT repeat protein